MPYAHLSAEDKAGFWEDGFLVKRHCFDDEEVGLVQRALVEDSELRESVINRQRAFDLPDDEWGAHDQIVQIIWKPGGWKICSAQSRGARDWSRGRSFYSGARSTTTPTRST